MKTRTNKVVKTLCTAVVMFGMSANVMPNTNEQADDRQPVMQAQQVYKYTYSVENYQGSIAHDVELAQADIMADLQVSREADVTAALERSAAELQGYALLASARAPLVSMSDWAIEAVTTLLPSFKARAYL